MYEAVLSAKANTEQLQYALRTLYHGIREFQRDIIEQNDINLLLQDHFGAYKQMSDHIYHPIKTMDSVHRYMVPIQSLLTDILADDGLLQSMRDRAVTIKKYDDESEAEDEITKAIDYIMDTYQSVGDLVSEIDRKHSAYTKSSIDKIQYLMTADQTIKGKLAEILKAYASATDEKRDTIATIMVRSIHADRQEFLDASSLYHKNIKNRRVDRTPLAVEHHDALPDSADDFLLAQIQTGYPLVKVRSFVDGLFANGARQITTADIPIENDSDFILVILAAIRQNEKGLPYTVEMQDGRIERNGYLIPNMTIRKKEGAIHVE